MAMTVDEIKQAKISLESDIAKMLKAFEKTTGVRLGYFDIIRERPKEEKAANNPETVMMDKPYKTMNIKTVSVDVRFDE